MISFVCSSREPQESFKDHVIKMCGLGKSDTEFLFYKNNGEFSLSNIYNKGIRDAKNDIIVFLHDDMEIESSNFGKKILKHFEKNPEYGILGVAGTRNLVSGQWWENKNSMMGIVNHKSGGKKWTSKYSANQEDEIADAIVLDGVFFIVNKLKIKSNFDESFNGFHFYDIAFCFKNYIEGVKLGVITNIRIIHFSIGATNQQWLDNKLQFEEKYLDKLPIKLERKFFKNEKLKVLIGCLSFQNFTGSELHVFELAKELIKQGCDVTVCSQIGGDLSRKAKLYGIKLASIQEPPGYKLGDGKWGLNTPDGVHTSQQGQLYKIEDVKFDILHLNHKPITEHLLKLYPNVEAICSIHSEVIELEHPVIHPQIKKYIAIRPEIKEYLIDRFDINPNAIDVIYNPIDYDRFKIIPNYKKRDKERFLFVGTVDYLRRESILDLINKTKESNSELWIVGKKHDNYLDNINESHVKYFEPTWNIEKYVQDCDTVVGILLGRTTIEGWLCGKPAIIYDVDESGTIKSISKHEAPTDIDKFRADNVVKEIINEYKQILN